MENKEETVSFGIVRIKDLAFEMDETAEVDEKLSSHVTFNNMMSFSVEHNQVHFVIEALFFTDKVENSTFMKGKVLTSFHIVDMQKFITAETKELDLPKAVLVAMFSISFSHTRALIAKASMSSRFTSLYLPLINPQEMLENLLQSKD